MIKDDNKIRLPFFPKKGIIFLDNCAFDKDDYILRNIKKKEYSLRYLKEDTARLESLTTQLSVMNNWYIIREVLEEFIDGNSTFKYKIRYLKSIQVRKAFEKLLKQREKTLILLDQKHVIANNSLVIKLEDIINEINPQVEERFNIRKGKTNKKKTDIKLISLALAYARQDYSFIFSQDQILLRTFSDCARNLGLYNKTYIISDRFRNPIPTRDCDSEFRRIKNYREY